MFLIDKFDQLLIILTKIINEKKNKNKEFYFKILITRIKSVVSFRNV